MSSPSPSLTCSCFLSDLSSVTRVTGTVHPRTGAMSGASVSEKEAGPMVFAEDVKRERRAAGGQRVATV